MAIVGAHAVVHTSDADGVRALLRDAIGLPHIDAGNGWLIFALPPAEVAVHPGEGPARAELYLMCDDIHATVAELHAKGVETTGPVADSGWGSSRRSRCPTVDRSGSTSRGIRGRSTARR